MGRGLSPARNLGPGLEAGTPVTKRRLLGPQPGRRARRGLPRRRLSGSGRAVHAYLPGSLEGIFESIVNSAAAAAS